MSLPSDPSVAGIMRGQLDILHPITRGLSGITKIPNQGTTAGAGVAPTSPPTLRVSAISKLSISGPSVADTRYCHIYITIPPPIPVDLKFLYQLQPPALLRISYTKNLGE